MLAVCSQFFWIIIWENIPLDHERGLTAVVSFKGSIPWRNVSKVIALTSRESSLEYQGILVKAKVASKSIASSNSWT